jgi:5'-phosphate synthase pdxT subunit
MKIGVLALQGSFVEHADALRSLGAEAVLVRKPHQLEGLRGIIIPGGESTAIGMLMARYKLLEKLRELAGRRLAVFGTCAGLILMAEEIEGGNQPGLGIMNITIARNAFGRQLDSFEEELSIPVLGPDPFHGVFIRAPLIVRAGKGVSVLARLNDGRIVAAMQGKLFVSSFHPELAGDLRLHSYFLEAADGL